MFYSNLFCHVLWFLPLFKCHNFPHISGLRQVTHCNCRRSHWATMQSTTIWCGPCLNVMCSCTRRWKALSRWVERIKRGECVDVPICVTYLIENLNDFRVTMVSIRDWWQNFVAIIVHCPAFCIFTTSNSTIRNWYRRFAPKIVQKR